MDEILASIGDCPAVVPLFISGLGSPRKETPAEKKKNNLGLPHSEHAKQCPPLPEEGVRATLEAASATDPAEEEAVARAAHFARWRQAVIDAEVLRRPEGL